MRLVVKAEIPDDPFLKFFLAMMSAMTKKPIPKYLVSSGSGVVLGNGKVVTANHVVDIEQRISVIGATEKGKKFGCRILAQDKSRDLALLQCDGINRLAGIHSFASLSLPIGSRVVASGYAGGGSLVISDGILSTRELNKGKMLVSALSGPGMSGGAVFTYDGRLVGLIQAGYRQPPFTMISTNSLQLLRFLYKHKLVE